MARVRLTPKTALRLGYDLLAAYGSTPDNARVVAEHLVESERVGLPSHGVMRLPQYVDEILAHEIEPAAQPTSHSSGKVRLDLDGRRCFGQVAAKLAVINGIDVAKEHGMALVTVRQCGHAGRIGAYAEDLGTAGYLSIIFCSGPRSGHRVAPFGGRDGRLATNPMAFGIPTSSAPIVGDFSTAASPEGRIRNLKNLGLKAPPETLLDANGMPTVDPNVLYDKPPGTILPLGGEVLGHRGFALGLLVEAAATLLTGDATSDGSRVGNNLAMVVVSVDEAYRRRADDMGQYVLGSRPRESRTLKLPGQLEREHRGTNSEFTVDDTTWESIVVRARNVGVDVE